MSEDAQKAERKKQEAWLRRHAARMGLAVQKSRARDPLRMDYGRYRILDVETGCMVAGRFPYGYTLALEDIWDVLEEIRIDRSERARRG